MDDPERGEEERLRAHFDDPRSFSLTYEESSKSAFEVPGSKRVMALAFYIMTSHRTERVTDLLEKFVSIYFW